MDSAQGNDADPVMSQGDGAKGPTRSVPFLCAIGENVIWIPPSHGPRELVSMTEGVQPISVVSEWVLEKIGEVNRVVGLSFERVEQEAWALFAKLDCKDVEGGYKGNMDKFDANC